MGDTHAPAFALWFSHIPVDFGALGVALFFLLSGYVIAISLEKYSRLAFVVGRLMRVLPTYAAGYLFSCLVVALMSDPQHELHLSSILIGMVPGLRFVLVQDVPGDGIVWTLIVELIFYVLCVVFFRKLTNGWVSVVLVCLLCALTQALLKPQLDTALGGATFLALLACPFLPVMLFGVVLSSLRRGSIAKWTGLLLLAFLAMAYLYLASTTDAVKTSLLYRMTFLGGMALFACVYWLNDRWKGQSVFDYFAKISYPLYVVHPVLGYAMLWVLVERHVNIGLALLATTMCAIGVASVVHYLVEQPTHRLGQRWARALSAPVAGPTPAPAVT